MEIKIFWFVLITGIRTEFGPSAQEEIVNVHNTLRSSIAKGTYVFRGIKPSIGAANMVELIWNASLADSAQRYSATCPRGHSNWSDIGENLYWNFNTTEQLDLDRFGAIAARAWENEFNDIGWDFNVHSKDLSKGNGHALIMSRAKYRLVGCGVTNCGIDPTADVKNLYRLSVVCHYKNLSPMPPGPFIYQPGPAGSDCPRGYKGDALSGLCKFSFHYKKSSPSKSLFGFLLTFLLFT